MLLLKEKYKINTNFIIK